MPKKYDALKKKFMKEGMSEDAAQSKAAAIFVGTSKNRSRAAKSLQSDRKKKKGK